MRKYFMLHSLSMVVKLFKVWILKDQFQYIQILKWQWGLVELTKNALFILLSFKMISLVLFP